MICPPKIRFHATLTLPTPAKEAYRVARSGLGVDMDALQASGDTQITSVGAPDEKDVPMPPNTFTTPISRLGRCDTREKNRKFRGK